MKTIIYVFLFSLLSGAGLVSANQNQEQDVVLAEAQKPLTTEAIRSRIEISGEVFVFDSSGKRLLFKGRESREWRPNNQEGKIVSNWGVSGSFHKPIELKTLWEVTEDGQLKVHIEQYERAEDARSGRHEDMKYINLLRKEDLVIENFAPVMWRSMVDKENVVIVRMTPRLRDVSEAQDVADLPLSGQDMIITDQSGQVWARDVTVANKFVTIGTHKGTLALSYYPFKGSQTIGSVKRNEMDLKLEKNIKINLISTRPFIPEGMRLKVYGRYLPSQKTPRLTSVRTSESNREERFLERLQ